MHAQTLLNLAQTYPTPFFAYDAETIRTRVSALTDAFKGQRVTLHYAVKANDNPAIIAMAAKTGIGACLVSAGEMKRALAGRMPASHMLMNGVAKSDADIRFALMQGIGQLNVESLPELHEIARIAADLNVTATICLRINPEVTATTHTHITTARRTDKFGLLVEDVPEAKRIIATYPQLRWVGFSCHIGSQIQNVAELEASYAVMVNLMTAEKANNPSLDRLDLGGGFGVSYKGDAYAHPADFAPVIARLTADLQAQGVTIQLEPGRYIAAEAGTLVTRVRFVKHSGGLRFLIVDSAMNNLLRPALYQAFHPITLLRATTAGTSPASIVGPICESSDAFARDRMMPDDIAAGDVLGIEIAGAYGYVMSGTYNARDLLAEILYDGSNHMLIRKSLSAEALDAITLPPMTA